MPWDTASEWKEGLDNVGMTDFFKQTAIPTTLGEVLSNGNWEVIFHQFATAEYSAENLDFLRAVAVFESSGDLNQAAEIYKQFIPESAPTQVNITGATRRDLEAIFGEGGDGEGPPSLFDAAKTEVFNLTSRDTFQRFANKAAKAKEEMA